VADTTDHIWPALLDRYMPTTSEALWMQKADGFAKNCNFPNAVGALDGKHVRIRCPKKSGSQFHNYKSFFSIVLMAIADADMNFTVVTVGSAGRESDAGIFLSSGLSDALISNSLNLPQPRPLPGEQTDTPFVLLGDEAFPLRYNLMRPYGCRKGEMLSYEQRIYNYRLSRARLSVEHAFGLLLSRWQIFDRPMKPIVATVENIVKSCVILNNFVNSRRDRCDCIAEATEAVLRSDGAMVNPPATRLGNYRVDATAVREHFRDYFVSANGRIQWQDNRI